MLKAKHPWIFRSHLSSAANVLKTGDYVELVDASNVKVGYGVFDEEGLIAIRVIKFGSTAPTTEWFQSQIKKAIGKRAALKNYTNAYRVIHGENDGFPGVVLEVYEDTLILQVYASSMDRLGRYVASSVQKDLGLKHILLKEPQKRIQIEKKEKREVRILRGNIPSKIKVKEGKHTFQVDVAQGQKSGTFLDLRGLRKWVAAADLKNQRVLNLFSYTGTLGLMAEEAKAKQVWNVDISQGAMDFAKKYHTKDPARHQFIQADIFQWLESLGAHEKYDLVIVDPPNMGTKKEQVPQIMRAYEKLYRLSQKHVAPKGALVACCCTSRIERSDFARAVDRFLPEMKVIKELQPEDDHPVGFPQGDYLKIRIYKRKS